MSDDMNKAWLAKTREVLEDGISQDVRGTRSVELINSTISVDMTKPILTVKDRDLGYRFMFAEAEWILNGKNDVASIEPYSPIIKNFSDDGIWFQGAYGPKLVDQLSYVVDSLTSDLGTRQAVATIWSRNPRASKDHSCTVSIQWLIRHGKLHCIDTMRSSDIWLGVPYDVFNFSMYSAYIALVLRSKGVDVDLGTLHLNAGSQHLYSNNFVAAANIADRLPKEPSVKAFDYAPFSLDGFSRPSDLVDYLGRAKDIVIEPSEWLYSSIDDISKGKRAEGWYDQ